MIKWDRKSGRRLFRTCGDAFGQGLRFLGICGATFWHGLRILGGHLSIFWYLFVSVAIFVGIMFVLICADFSECPFPFDDRPGAAAAEHDKSRGEAVFKTPATAPPQKVPGTTEQKETLASETERQQPEGKPRNEPVASEPAPENYPPEKPIPVSPTPATCTDNPSTCGFPSSSPLLKPGPNTRIFDNAHITITAVSVTLGIVTVLIATLSFFGFKWLEKLRAIEKKFKKSLKDFEDFRDRMVLDWHLISRKVDKIVEEYVKNISEEDVRADGDPDPGDPGTRIPPGEDTPATDDGFIAATGPRITLLDVQRDCLQWRMALIGLDGFGNTFLAASRKGVPIAVVQKILSQKIRPTSKISQKENKEHIRKVNKFINSAVDKSNNDSKWILEKCDKGRYAGNVRKIANKILEYMDFLEENDRILPASKERFRELRDRLIELRAGAT